MAHQMKHSVATTSQLKPVLGRAAIIAIILGTGLTLLNQPEVVFDGADIDWLSLTLVYLTPFLVVSVSQVLGHRAARIASTRMTGLPENFFGTLFSHGIPTRAVALSLIAGSITTAIGAAEIVLAGHSLDQLSFPLVIQALVLPAVFGALSQAFSFRRTIKSLARPAFADSTRE